MANFEEHKLVHQTLGRAEEAEQRRAHRTWPRNQDLCSDQTHFTTAKKKTQRGPTWDGFWVDGDEQKGRCGRLI